jgi:hypothetical protein
MSSTFAGLRSLFKGRHPEQPSDLDPNFKVDVPDGDEGGDVEQASPYINADLAGEVFGIEYKTAQGSVSRRWVSVEGFKRSSDGEWSICAFCFVRNRVRSFSLEQIQAIFDAQGEPVALSEIFPAGHEGAPAPDVLANTSGRAIIAACRDGLRALTALAKIDGHLHDKELETVVSFAAATAKKAGLAMTPDDREAVERYVGNLQPTGDVVADSLDRIAQATLATQKEFFWYAHEVMDADGLQDEAEIKMFLEISEALSHEI